MWNDELYTLLHGDGYRRCATCGQRCWSGGEQTPPFFYLTHPSRIRSVRRQRHLHRLPAMLGVLGAERVPPRLRGPQHLVAAGALRRGISARHDGVSLRLRGTRLRARAGVCRPRACVLAVRDARSPPRALARLSRRQSFGRRSPATTTLSSSSFRWRSPRRRGAPSAVAWISPCGQRLASRRCRSPSTCPSSGPGRHTRARSGRPRSG